MRYRDEKFYWTYEHGVHWSDDYIGPDSMTWWIIEGSVGFTDVGFYKILESIRAYAYLILSSQASARSSIIGNTVSALTAQSAFLNKFENIVNCRVDIREDIKRYQDTLSYTSSKVDYSMGRGSYMFPSDMNLKIKTGTVRTIIKFSYLMVTLVWGNDEVHLSGAQGPTIKSHKTNSLSQKPNFSHNEKQEPQPITHNDEKVALVLFVTGGFAIWNIFQ